MNDRLLGVLIGFALALPGLLGLVAAALGMFGELGKPGTYTFFVNIGILGVCLLSILTGVIIGFLVAMAGLRSG